MKNIKFCWQFDHDYVQKHTLKIKSVYKKLLVIIEFSKVVGYKISILKLNYISIYRQQ